MYRKLLLNIAFKTSLCLISGPDSGVSSGLFILSMGCSLSRGLPRVRPLCNLSQKLPASPCPLHFSLRQYKLFPGSFPAFLLFRSESSAARLLLTSITDNRCGKAILGNVVCVRSLRKSKNQKLEKKEREREKKDMEHWSFSLLNSLFFNA